MINEDLDYTELDRLFDRTRAKLFLGNNAAFLGSILGTLNFTWSSDIKTACTNGLSLQWNPYWFLKLPEETRRTVLAHELWHVAFLDMIRRGDREPKVWNYACDIRINNLLKREGYSFIGTKPWLDSTYGDQIAEDIYDSLIAKAIVITNLPNWGHEEPDGTHDDGDLVEPEESTNAPVIINNVVGAAVTSGMTGGDGVGTLPGEVETVLKRFLNPKLPWEQLLFNFFNELSERDFSWARPNRRYENIYLPSLGEPNGLEHLIYYLDVSGSVSDNEVIRFNSEVKFIKEQFNPIKLTLVLFDDVIQKEYEFNQEDPFEEVVIVGRGGTDLKPVREHILKQEPTAAIIFSDLHCEVMEKLPIQIPIIWVCVNNQKAKVNEGQLIHIKE